MGELFIGEVSTHNCTGITFLEIGEPENAGLLKWRMIKLLQKYIEFVLDGEVINDLPKFVNGKPQSPLNPSILHICRGDWYFWTEGKDLFYQLNRILTRI